MRKLNLIKKSFELTKNDTIRALDVVKNHIDQVRNYIKRDNIHSADQMLEGIIDDLKEIKFSL